MQPPGTIRVINPDSRAVFEAHPTGIYSPANDTFQYRVEPPYSLVVLDIPTSELRHFILFGNPIPVRPLY